MKKFLTVIFKDVAVKGIIGAVIGGLIALIIRLFSKPKKRKKITNSKVIPI